jgi:hypothetical protein
MKTIEKLGTTWTVENGLVTVYMTTLGRDAYSVAAGCRNWQGWGYDARDATPDDCPPEVPCGLVIIRVPIQQWDKFIAGVVASDEDHFLFPTVDDAWDGENGDVEYTDTPWGEALTGMVDARMEDTDVPS